MCNYPWWSLTPGIIFWILRLSLSVKFWMLKKNTAVPVTKVLISVSFLYHPLPPPPGVSVSQEPDVAVSVLHLQHWYWPSDWVSKCEPPNTFRPSPTCCRWRTQSRGHHCCQDIHSWQEGQAAPEIQASHWSWCRMSVNPPKDGNVLQIDNLQHTLDPFHSAAVTHEVW